MKDRIITIADNGNVTVPSETKMSISEIAELFGIYYQTAKRLIFSIEKQRSTERSVVKSNIADRDYSMGCIVSGNHIYAEYYGLDMVIAVAFRVQSKQAEIFRRWITRRVTDMNLSQTIL